MNQRILRGPSAGATIVSAIKLEQGGHGGTTLAAAKTNLDILGSDLYDQPLGPAKLSASGLKSDDFDTPIGGSGVTSLQGPTSLQINQTGTYLITNYDMTKTYALSVTTGTVSRVGDTITYVAGTTPNSAVLTVNDKAFTITVVDSKPYAPSVVTPAGGATNQQRVVAVTSSAFSSMKAGDAHQSSDWEISTVANFSSLVGSSYNDTVNKTSWNTPNLTISTTYYVRVRHKGTTSGLVSDWSAAVAFTTAVSFIPSNEEAKLLPGNSNINAQFGRGISMTADGSRVVVGAVQTTGTYGGQGAAYLFLRTGSTWTQEARLDMADPAKTNEYMGFSVQITNDGTRIAVGAYGKQVTVNGQGAVYVFRRTSTWVQEARLVASDAGDSVYFGIALSINADGDTLAIGAHQRSGGGAFYQFTRTNTTWSQTAVFSSPGGNTTVSFGTSMRMTPDGTYLVVGSSDTVGGNSSSGAVYVFTRTVTAGQTTSFVFQARLLPDVSQTSQLFGGGYQNVAISDDSTRIAVGASGKTVTANGQGAVFVFLRTGGSWTQEVRLVAADAAASNSFGYAVSMSGNGLFLAIGAYGQVGGTAYIFSRSGTTWSQAARFKNSDTTSGDSFGVALGFSQDGTRLAVGAYSKNGTYNSQGAAYVYS